MSEEIYKKPILNSPYEYPSSHWEMVSGFPSQKIIRSRRRAEFITPILKPKKQNSATAFIFD